MYGEAIKKARKKQKYTQVEVSTETGIPQQSISSWESNSNEPSIVNCVQLADFYDISLDELIGRERHYNENNNITQNNIFGNNIYNKEK